MRRPRLIRKEHRPGVGVEHPAERGRALSK
jgi:hypothetical protein